LGPDRDANIVNCVVEDSQGVLWCGTNAGLYQVRRDSVFAVPGFAEVGVVSQLCMLGDSLMYVGAERDVYLLSVRTGRVRHVLATRIFGDPAFAFIAEDESRIWIISKDSTLYQIRGDTILAKRHLPVDAYTWSQLWMLRDEEGFLLIGARDGIKMVAREGWQQNDLIQYTIENGLPKSGFTCGLVDRENNLWFGSELKGLFKLSERSTLAFQLPEVTTGVMNN
jgi:ligand-binding sensor domain-containing protein